MIGTGIIQYTGSGKQQQIVIRKQHPLANTIKELLETEKRNYDALIKNLKEVLRSLELKPKSAWIFGKVAQRSDDYGDPLRIALLGDVKSIDDITEEFRNRLYKSDLEKHYDVTIEISGVTLADVETRPIINTNKIILLWGMDPLFYTVGSKDERDGKRLHEDFDKQSLIDSKAWTELLKTHPEIIQRAIQALEDRITDINSGEKKELQEWKHILESMSFQRLKKFLESDSERSARLRQSLPFWPVLNDSERTTLEKIKTEQTQSHE
jgi:vacuolar-type H+-ATPase subunit E/Vma4